MFSFFSNIAKAFALFQDATAEYAAAVAEYLNPNTPTVLASLEAATVKLLEDAGESAATSSAVSTYVAQAVQAVAGGTSAPAQELAALKVLAGSHGIAVPSLAWTYVSTLLTEVESYAAGHRLGK